MLIVTWREYLRFFTYFAADFARIFLVGASKISKTVHLCNALGSMLYSYSSLFILAPLLIFFFFFFDLLRRCHIMWRRWFAHDWLRLFRGQAITLSATWAKLRGNSRTCLLLQWVHCCCCFYCLHGHLSWFLSASFSECINFNYFLPIALIAKLHVAYFYRLITSFRICREIYRQQYNGSYPTGGNY